MTESGATTAREEYPSRPVSGLDGEEVDVCWSTDVVEEEARDGAQNYAVVETEIEDDEDEQLWWESVDGCRRRQVDLIARREWFACVR